MHQESADSAVHNITIPVLECNKFWCAVFYNVLDSGVTFSYHSAERYTGQLDQTCRPDKTLLQTHGRKLSVISPATMPSAVAPGGAGHYNGGHHLPYCNEIMQM